MSKLRIGHVIGWEHDAAAATAVDALKRRRCDVSGALSLVLIMPI